MSAPCGYDTGGPDPCGLPEGHEGECGPAGSEDARAEGWVYLSDASWSASGNRSGTRYHWPSRLDPGRSACGFFVLQERGRPAGQVNTRLRCKRTACADRYVGAANLGVTDGRG